MPKYKILFKFIDTYVFNIVEHFFISKRKKRTIYLLESFENNIHSNIQIILRLICITFSMYFTF